MYSFISSALCQFSKANMVRQYSQKLLFRHFVVKEIGDALVLQLLVGGEEQLHDLHGALVGDVKLAVGVGVLARG